MQRGEFVSNSVEAAQFAVFLLVEVEHLELALVGNCGEYS
jgi:hypothetical protein